MYGLPDDFDPAFLEGQTVLQVCVGENEVILHLEGSHPQRGGISITIMSTAVVVEGAQAVEYDEPRQLGSSLVTFLGCSTTRSTSDASGRLRLDFGVDRSIELRDDADQFESYVIAVGDRTVIV